MKFNIKFLKNILLISIIIMNTSFVFAQDMQYEMVSYATNSKDASTPFFNLAFFNKPTFTINYASFSSAWQFLFDLVIGASIATAVVVFMVGAFEGILSQNSANEKKKGKDRMQNAIIGLMVILSTWLIINTINPDLLRLPIFQGIDKLGATNGANTTTSGTQSVNVSDAK